MTGRSDFDSLAGTIAAELAQLETSEVDRLSASSITVTPSSTSTRA